MASINGTTNFDYLLGTAEADSLQAFDGNDIVFGLKGDDAIAGNAGKDKLFGNESNDIIAGGDGEDIICGGKGDDSLAGDADRDILYGDLGSDTLVGGAGDDTFVLAKGSGGSTPSTANYITDFGNGRDTIRLLNGLQFSDLNIIQGTGANSNDTIIQDKLTGEFLAILQGVNRSAISQDAFATFISGEIVTDWNKVLLEAVRTANTAPPVAARNMAIAHVAIYDAVNSITKAHKPYRIDAPASPETSPEAATAAAAHRVLVTLYPAQKAKFDAALASSLADIPEGASKNDGIALGQSVADSILAIRSTDGASATVSYTPGTDPGEWIPTPPAFAASLLPQWPDVTPFAMTRGSQFRPDGPPALDSVEYANEVNFVKAIGSQNSTTRTPEQTTIAKFWANGAGTFTPPGHWNQIAETTSELTLQSLEEAARTYALLNIALADAAIVAWDAKYAYNFWRPITAIQQADRDGNSATTADPNWQPLLVTPPFSEYISGHSTFSGAADGVMSALFGSDFGFVDSGDPNVNTLRSFNSFKDAADESGISRLYGGIHFQSANEDGLTSGRNLGNYVVQNFLV